MDNLFNNFKQIDIGNYIIRSINENDYKDIYSIYGDPEVMKYDMNNLLKSLDDAKNNIKIIHRAILNKWFIRLAIIDKYTNEFIGTIALHHFEFDKNKVQIGYNLKKNYWGKGIMSDVLKSTIDYLHLNSSLKEIEASIYTENIASLKLAKKLGFKLNNRESNKLIFTKKIK
ncbi:GNAT family N-acetyltransferase [Paeniclostridium sp. NSJ-45]|uniref:GNAT family N-acetyltransferase n=1 Tax=Paeniclostridium hominis TaxID=2764329 RepID=A0ABR7K1J8_9FIRM|nr:MULTISPECIES: GNAT family N-acetyltransferase [Paeniclostridium]MBC6002967.1 GNAT family N-acetyltransferase [Paeniclostridium hominis]